MLKEKERTISRWSMSRLHVYESCPYRAKLAFVDRVPEPERGEPPKGKAEWPDHRGSRIHEACEAFVKGEGTLPEEAAQYFDQEFQALQLLYNQGKVDVEQEWGVNADWECVGWEAPDLWGRAKLDACVRLDDDKFGIVIDYKTGKRVFNEIKHGEQTMLYQLLAFLKYPSLKKLVTELWYLDLGEIRSMNFTRTQGMKFLRTYDSRARKMTTATEFPPTPSPQACRFCPYSTKGTGHCKVGIV